MTLARIKSIALVGLTGHLIDIEVDISDGLPGYTLLGLPDAALSESRERVRSALLNSGAPWPNKRVTVSLSPAWLPKSGSGFDLPIAVALLIAQGLIAQGDMSRTVLMGELALDGGVKPIRGVLPALLAASHLGIDGAVVPDANLAEARAVKEIEVVGIKTLTEVISFLETGEIPEQIYSVTPQSTYSHRITPPSLYRTTRYWQDDARRENSNSVTPLVPGQCFSSWGDTFDCRCFR